MEDQYTYNAQLTWTAEKKGFFSVEGFPALEIATPPEFGGHPGIWSPEHLLVASVASCIMTTFIAIAEASRFPFVGFKSDVVGTIERVDGKYQFTRIEITVELGVGSEDQVSKGERLLQKAEENCFISNSITAEVVLTPKVGVA